MNDKESQVRILKKEKVGRVTFMIGQRFDENQKRVFIGGMLNVSLLQLGIESIDPVIQSSNYLEVGKWYYEQIQEHFTKICIEESKKPRGIIRSEDCHSIFNYKSLVGKIVVLDSAVLLDEYQSETHQLYLATGGFGTNPNSRGNAVYAMNLYTGEETRLESYELLGVIKKNRLPAWAKEKCEALYPQKKKELEHSC